MKKNYQIKRFTGIVFLYAIIFVYYLILNSLQAQDLNDKESKKFFKEAEKAYNKGNYNDAMELYFSVIRQNPEHIESLYKIALIDYDVNKRYSEAKKRFIKTRDIIRNYLKQANNGLSEKEKIAYQDLQSECNNKASSCDTREKEYKNNKSESSDVSQNKPVTQTKTQLETAKAVKVVKKSEEANYDKNLPVDPQLDYIDKKVIKFKDEDKEKQIKQLQNYLDSLQKFVYKNNFSGRHLQDEIRAINNRWMTDNSIKMLSWIKELNTYERDFIVKQRNLNIKREAHNGLLKEIKDLEISISILNEKIIQEKNELKNLNGKINDDFKESLNNKLTNIPISIVLIGKSEFSERNLEIIKQINPENNINGKSFKTVVKDYIDDELRLKAIEQLKGNFISSYYTFLSDDKSLKSMKEKVLSGRAQIASTFYKSIRKADPLRNGIENIFSILRIEVFPFESQQNLKRNSKQNGKKTEEIVDVFKLTDESNILENISTFKRVSTNDLDIGFEKEHEDFIKSLYEESEKLNKEYSKNINEAYEEYKIELKKAFDEKSEIENKINKYYSEINLLEEKKNALQKQYDQPYELETAREEYKISQRKYDEMYQTKRTYTNKFEVVNTDYYEDLPNTIPSYLAAKCYSKIDEMKNERINISVLLENNGQNEIKYTNKTSISLKPIATGFQVISFDNLISGASNYFLNVAFELTWKEESRQTNNFDIDEQKNEIAKNELNKSSETDNLVLNDNKENVTANADNQQNNSEVITEIQIQPIVNEEIAENSIENNSQNEINTDNAQINLQTGVIINEEAKTITDNDNRLIFMFFHDNPTSFKTWNKSRDGEWRLPSDNELRIFLKIAQQKKLEGNNFAETFNSFMECYNFIYDNAYKNEEGTSFHQGFLLNPDNFEFTPQNFEDAESVHIVIVKNL